MATETIAIVGCGDAKRDIGENETIPLKKLYTSNYFQLKHYFAEELCDDYRILSAKFGLANPDLQVEERYDLSIDDLDKQELNEWRQSVESDFQLLPEGANLVILLGRSYVDAIHRPLARHDGAIAFPFEETSGIGDQMHWLSEHLNQASTTDCSFLFDSQSNIDSWE